MNRVLMVAVHPDDETLGCGGTLLKHKSRGDEIHWVIATEIKESERFSGSEVESRNVEINEVSKLYSFDSVHRLGLETTKVDEYSMSDLIGRVSKVVNEIKPNIIYLPFKSDVHSDHRKVFEAAYSCTKSFRYPFVQKVMMVETLSETEFVPSMKEDAFVPNIFVDVSGFMEKKLEIMRVFDGELGEHPFPRSERNLLALATFRGATVGCEYAESFVLLKEVI